ncbi:hypothetical protein LIER_07717 [Lithospermum erythrorhizon]|uniref:Uncharacterized protein n=1 Tax=Lithospermum erythrorhizon TaxID=34254 RepID=A0AAV3PC04_LITER
MRLYTPLGAEFTIGDLDISQVHDPIANLAIPQDVALDVVIRLNEWAATRKMPRSFSLNLVKELQEETERLKADVALAISEKTKVQDQAQAEINKHDLLHAQFTRLEETGLPEPADNDATAP